MDALAYPFHKFGYLLAAEQQKYSKEYYKPFPTA